MITAESTGRPSKKDSTAARSPLLDDRTETLAWGCMGSFKLKIMFEIVVSL